MFGIETIFETLPQFLIVCAILALAEAVYVLLGFGAGLIAVGTMALLLPELKDAVVILLLVNLPAELWIVRSSWQRISWRGVLVIFIGVAIGTPLGTSLLRWGDARFLLIVLGVFLVAVGAVFLFIKDARKRQMPRWIAGPIGVISGVLTGLFGTGGPPVIVLLKGYGLDKGAFRATLISFFLLMSLMRGGTYINAGLLTTEELLAALWLLPASLAGTVLGMVIHGRLSERFFGYAVSLLLILLGGLLVIGR